MQIVRGSKAGRDPRTNPTSALHSKTNSAFPSHRGVYIEVGFKGATEVINDISQKFLAEQARFKEVHSPNKHESKSVKNGNPNVNVIGFMLTKMGDSNEYVEQIIQ